VQDDEGIAAQAALHRQQDAFGGSDCYRRVERVAAALQNGETDERRHRMGRRHHAARAESLRPLPHAVSFARRDTPRSVVSIRPSLVCGRKLGP
jgi:hypothetical protein